jgi:AcrR family transcriptional regulator
LYLPEDTDGGDKLQAMASVEEQVPAVHLRADAARNRERIIEAAAEVFAERGLEVSTAEIAEHAGVGEATLFRRFPTKDVLIDAILDQKMGETVEFLAELAADDDPEAAFERIFIEMIGEKMQTDQGFYEAAGERCMANPDFSHHRARSLELIGVLLKRAQEAGVVRDDLQPQDINFLVMAASAPLRMPLPGLRPDLYERYARIILDGMRPEGATKLRPPAPPKKLIVSPGS